MKILDSDIMIDLLRQYPPAVTWLASLGNEELLLVIVEPYSKP
jgi:hypothetical protein